VGSPDLAAWRAVPLGDAAVAQTLDLSCGGEVCVVATRSDDGVAVWRVRADGRAESSPSPPGAQEATWAQVAVTPGGESVVAFGGNGSSVARWVAGKWRLATAPPGEVRDLLATDEHLLAIVGDGDAENSPRRLVIT
jgi:hypothetical protein